MCLEKVEFILNPILSLCHFLGSLVRLKLDEFSVVSPLGFELSLVHFHRQLATAGKPLQQALVPGLVIKVLIRLVTELILILNKVHNILLI